MRDLLGTSEVSRYAEVREMAGRAGLGAVVYLVLGVVFLVAMFGLLLGAVHWVWRGMALPVLFVVVLCLETGLRDLRRWRRLRGEVRRLGEQPE